MTKIKVSPLFLVLAVVMIFSGGAIAFLSYTIAVTFHEFAHAEVAKRRGYVLSHIKLMPYGASLTGAFEGVKWKDEFVIALAGPVSNIILGIFFIALWWLTPVLYIATETFVIANFLTALTNLVPVFPLDGGRALVAVLSRKFKRQKVYRAVRFVGFAISLVFCVFFVMSFIKKINVSFALIALFIFFSTVFPDKNCKYQRLYSMAFRSEKIKRGLTVKEIMVDESVTVMGLLKMVNSNYYHKFTVVNAQFKPVLTLTETELEEISLKMPSDKCILEGLTHVPKR